MQRIIRIWAILFLLIAGSQVIFSQNVELSTEEIWDNNNLDRTTEILENDSILLNESLDLKKFEPDFQQKYQDEEFDYERTKPKESILARIKKKINQWLLNLFNSSDANKIENITKWILRIIAVGIILLVLFWVIKFLTGKDGNWFFAKKNKELNPEASDIVENIHEIDFNKTIAQYESTGNYRFALRYRFLHLLKVMTDRKIIEWNSEKTNLDYLAEIKDPAQQKQFGQLAKIFDYVWYGEFVIDKTGYEEVQEDFQKTHSQL